MSATPFLPDPPLQGTTQYPDPNENGRVWEWDGEKWLLVTETVVVYEGGPPGATGVGGRPGDAGATGLDGSIGASGPTGATGSIGLRGKGGDPGATGDPGPAGIAVCKTVATVPGVGKRGQLWIDGQNQIYVTVRDS